MPRYRGIVVRASHGNRPERCTRAIELREGAATLLAALAAFAACLVVVRRRRPEPGRSVDAAAIRPVASPSCQIRPAISRSQDPARQEWTRPE